MTLKMSHWTSLFAMLASVASALYVDPISAQPKQSLA